MPSEAEVHGRHPHWDDGGTRLLRELVFLFMHRRGPGANPPLTVTELEALLPTPKAIGPTAPDTTEENSVSTNGPRAARHAREGRLRDFLFNVTRSPGTTLLNDLFDLVVPWIAENSRAGELTKCRYLDQIEARNWFGYFRLPQKRRLRIKQSAIFGAADRARAVADMLEIGFNISARDYIDASSNLIDADRCEGSTPTIADQVGFLTYRYSTTAGNIIRTFTTITPISNQYRFCWFQNYYRYPERDQVRDTSGVVVKLGGHIYFFGVLPERDGLKMMVLPYSSGHAGLISGLIASTNNNGTPLVSRVALQRVAARHLGELGANQQPGVLIFPVDKAQSPSKEITWRIRNHIAFQVGDSIVWHRGKGKKEQIDAARMKSIVADRCKGMFSLYDIPFNPADHIHYPFNQALSLYKSEERPTPNNGRRPRSESAR